MLKWNIVDFKKGDYGFMELVGQRVKIRDTNIKYLLIILPFVFSFLIRVKTL
jgi:hypothetical protein